MDCVRCNISTAPRWRLPIICKRHEKRYNRICSPIRCSPDPKYPSNLQAWGSLKAFRPPHFGNGDSASYGQNFSTSSWQSPQEHIRHPVERSPCSKWDSSLPAVLITSRRYDVLCGSLAPKSPIRFPILTPSWRSRTPNLSFAFVVAVILKIWMAAKAIIESWVSSRSRIDIALSKKATLRAAARESIVVNGNYPMLISSFAPGRFTGKDTSVCNLQRPSTSMSPLESESNKLIAG